MELEDEEGNRISLIEKYGGSVANPAIRRCELMTRIRGFENIRNEMGFIGEFYTLTAPARFHAEVIDPEKGSATGYVAKYISKNIDGYALDGETDDESGKT